MMRFMTVFAVLLMLSGVSACGKRGGLSLPSAASVVER